MKRLAPIILAIPLLLSGCGEEPTENAPVTTDIDPEPPAAQPVEDKAVEECQYGVEIKASSTNLDFVEATPAKVTPLDDGAHQIHIAGDVDVRRLAGEVSEMGFTCTVIIEPGGEVRMNSVMLEEYLRGAYL